MAWIYLRNQFYGSVAEVHRSRVTLATGLSIGKVVFGALNRVEIVLAATVAVGVIAFDSRRAEVLMLSLPVMILLVQTFVLLPLLDARADLLISGVSPAPSHLHQSFLLLEVIKAGALLVFGWKMLISCKHQPATNQFA